MLCMFKIANKISCQRKKERKKNTAFCKLKPHEVYTKRLHRPHTPPNPNFYPVFGHSGRQKSFPPTKKNLREMCVRDPVSAQATQTYLCAFSEDVMKYSLR